MGLVSRLRERRLSRLGVRKVYVEGITRYIVDMSVKREARTPTDFSEHMTRAANAIRTDAKRKHILPIIEIVASGSHAEQFHQTIDDLAEMSEQQELQNQPDFWPIHARFLYKGPLTAGLVMGACLGYFAGSYATTQAAEYLNQTSHLLAPIAGGIQLLGTALITVIGGTLGLIAGELTGSGLTKPYRRINFPLAGKSRDYEHLRRSVKK